MTICRWMTVMFLSLQGMGCMNLARSSPDCEACRPGKHCLPGHYDYVLDDYQATQAAKACAKEALRAEPVPSGSSLNPHYESGFIQAYEDLALGGSGVVPPIPPRTYWSAHYRTSAGHREADIWFAGYRGGVASARQRGLYRFNRVAHQYDPGFPSHLGQIPVETGGWHPHAIAPHATPYGHSYQEAPPPAHQNWPPVGFGGYAAPQPMP